MASAAHKAWVSAGKPLSPCQPIRDYVTRLKAAFPRAAAANLFSWYTNDAHLLAVPPQDHTPFSATGWPVASPRWVVHATDVTHRPDLGVDCSALFPYWLSEARAGRTPWVKYLIWQARLYDVRNDWRPVGNSGHFDHVHISTRTDHEDTSLGAWPLIPGINVGGAAMAQMLIRNTDGGQLYLVDGMFRRKIDADQIAAGKISNTGVHQAGLLGLLGNGGQVFNTSGDMDVWGLLYPPAGSPMTGAQLAEVEAAAKAGAAEGVGGGTIALTGTLRPTA